LGADVKLEFLRPTLKGQRFQDHTVPLELIRDFSALQEMLVEVARWEFLKSRSDRQRIPRNFATGLELHLQAVEEGSAILKIVLVTSTLFSPHMAYFEQAKTDIVAAIASAEQGTVPSLPPRFLNYFDRFGRGLRSGEGISFASADGIATLTPETRERLMRSAEVKEWTEEVALRGRISEADHRRNSFEMELNDGIVLKGTLSDPYREAILNAFGKYNTGRDEYVLIQGVAKKDRDGHLKSFESIEHATQLDPLDITLRLEDLAKLQEGWLDGSGRSLNEEALVALANHFDTFFDDDLPLPFLYPTPEGGVQAEWNLNQNEWSVTLEVALEKLEGEFQAFNLKSKDCQEHLFSLDAKEGWDALNSALRQLANQPIEDLSVDV
jgi:hypothetical protein